MAKAARSPQLKKSFENHLAETQSQIQRLQQMFELLGEKVKGKPCKGMAGLVEEGQEVIKDGKRKEETMADLALIGAAQRVEHYEIFAYGTARAIAERIGESRVVRLLAQTLKEEENADSTLTKVAQPLLEEAAQSKIEQD